MLPTKPGFAFTILLVLVANSAGPAWAEDKPAVDSLGDPLPQGATARLGSMRWRHSGPVKFVAYANNGKEIISSADDGVFHVWDTESGKELRHFGEPNKNVNFANLGLNGPIGWQDPRFMYQVAVPDDGKTLAVSVPAPDMKIHIYDVATGKELRSFAHGHNQFSSGLAFSADGKTLVSRGPDQRIKVWDPAEGKVIKEFAEQGGGNVFWGNATMPLVVSPDGKMIAGASSSFENGRGVVFSLRMWDIKEGKELQQIKEGQVRGQMMTVWPAFTPDSKYIAWPTMEGPIRLYEAAGGKEIQKFGEDTTDRRVLRMQFTSDGKTLAVLSSDQTIVLYEASSGKKTKEIGEEPPGIYGKAIPKAVRANPLNYNMGNTLAFSPDGKTIVQGWGNLVRQWNIESGKGNDIYPGHFSDVSAVFLAADGKSALTAGGDNTVRKWEVATGKQAQIIELPSDANVALLAGPDRAVVRDDSSVRLVDLSTGKQTEKFDAGTGGAINPFTGLSSQMSLSVGGKSLAVSSTDQAVRVFNLETGKQVSEDKGLQFNDNQGRKMLFNVAASPDSASVAIQIQSLEWFTQPGGGINQQWKYFVRLHDTETGRTLWENNAVTGQCRCMVFSPNGRNLAFTNGDNNTVIMLEAVTGKERWRFTLPNIAAMTFSADSRFIAAGTMEGAIKIMDVFAQKEIASFQGNTGRLRSLAFSGDSATLLTGGADGTALVWNIHDQVEVARKPAEVDAATVKRLWGEIGDGDGAKGWNAVRTLAGAPSAAIPWIKEQVKPAKSEDATVLAKFIADLDSDDFETRQKAFDGLKGLGAQAAPALKKALDAGPSLEVRKHLEDLLGRLTPGEVALSVDDLREIRAIEVLEGINTPDARAVLEGIAKGAAGVRLTHEAAAALKRMTADK